MADEKKKKRPKDRKNPGMAAKHQAERHVKNALRPKQRWIEPAIDTGNDMSPAEGHWERP